MPEFREYPIIRYRIIRKIGEERLGAVFLANDLEKDRYVFYHRIDRSGKVLDIEIGRYLERARAISRLRSPHILPLLEIGENQESLFVVMALREGVTLRQKLRQGRLPADDSLRLSLELARALREAHERGICHGGLNPDMILVDSAGTLRVPFFGKPWWFERVAQIKTASEALFSEEVYQAPECLQGSVPDPQSDIYSAGVIMHELLHGSIPTRTSPKTISGPAASGAEAIPHDRKFYEFDRVIHLAMEKERDKRYKDTEAMIEELLFLIAREKVLQKEVILPAFPDVTWRDLIPWKFVMILTLFLFLLFLALFLYHRIL